MHRSWMIPNSPNLFAPPIPTILKREVIFPEKFTLEMLQEIRKDTRMGSYKFSAQYLNNPIDPSTADFRRDWIQFYEPNTPQPTSLYLTVDPAISLSRDADFSALMVCGQFENKKIRVVDYIRKKMVPSDLVDSVFFSRRQMEVAPC